MEQDSINIFALFRFALSYPDERLHAWFREFSPDTPETLEELRALYIGLFEAGLPHPRCPLLESHYVENRPSTEVVLENKLYYQHFGLQIQSKAAPDSLLSQLEFLSWLEHAIAAGNPDSESLENAKRDFLARNVRPYLPKLAAGAEGCYGALLEILANCD